MADENKPAFYPRVGNIKAKNFKPAKPMPFIDDERAMDLPQYGDIDLSQPTKANLEMGRRMAERDAQLRRQAEADRSPLEKLAGGVQAGRFLGSALTQAINSAPTRLLKGDEAADKFMQERMYKPEQPLAYEYAGDVGDFLEKLETQYKLPPVLPEAVALQYLAGPATSQATRAAGKGVVKAGMALERGMEPVVKGALERGGLPREMVMAMGANTQANVIKPKGGNWYGKGVEDATSRLKPYDAPSAEDKAWVAEQKAMREAEPESDARTRALRAINEDIALHARNEALNKWVDSNLTNYIKKEMATPEDPIRKLAEQGITHFPIAEDPSYWARRGEASRKNLGGNEMAQSDLAKQWENRTDAMMKRETAQQHQDFMHLAPGMYSKEDEWLKKLAPETNLYDVGLNPRDLGFDHILDVLRQDVAAGRIRPDQLNKVSMEQAVRRVHEYDQEMARKMAETQLKATEGMPIHKQYPEGYKWIELGPSKELPEGWTSKPTGSGGVAYYDPQGVRRSHPNADAVAEALKYEGNTMGHCVGGYCPDVLEGRSRIFSLRDTKGEPHVTVEVRPKRPQYEDIEKHFNQAHAEVLKDMNARGMDTSDPTKANGLAWKRAEEIANENPQMSIVQIKGKQNARPIEKYDPFTQDFVKSGDWTEVGDLKNTGLTKYNNQYLTIAEAENLLKPRTESAMKYLQEHPALEKYRQANKAYLEYKGPIPSDEYSALDTARGATVHPDIPYTYNELKAILEDPAAFTAGREEKYDTLAKNLDRIDALKKHYGELPPSPEMKRGGKVSISNNPDAMMLEVNNQKMAKGGLSKLIRAAPKSKAEIDAIARRMAPQLLGEFVRGDKGTQSVAGKTQKQFAKEKEMMHDIRPTGAERPLPKEVDIEDLKDQVMVGIAGDPTISGQTVHSVNGIPLESPSPQHGGPFYGLGHEDDAFWASGLGAANRVQNIAREASQAYDMPVLGNYVMMGPDSINYAQHYADANLAAINPAKMSKGQIEEFNKLVREGYPYTKGKERFQRVFPAFPGIENASEAYLHFSIDPELRKHFNALMQMPTVTEKYNLPSGVDIRHAVTEPDLRDLEIGVTGKSIGRLRPEITELGLSSHPTYSHDIPGEFMGTSKYPVPYELSFPDTVKSVRENPKQAPQEFGSFKYVGPRQVIDQQLIDEIKQYQEMIKKYTGKKEGGAIKQPAAYIDGNEFVEAAKKYGIKDSMNNLNKIVDLVNKGLSVDDAARQVADTGMHKAAGGAITGDDLIIEERPL